jgi:Lrp/AsnC family leucine-responsive transcriptional regulator
MVVGGFDSLVKNRIGDMEGYSEVLGRIVDLPGVSKNHTYVVIWDCRLFD